MFCVLLIFTFGIISACNDIKNDKFSYCQKPTDTIYRVFKN